MNIRFNANLTAANDYRNQQHILNRMMDLP
jgi:hypothetical protein